jgi:hypothetical protein
VAALVDGFDIVLVAADGHPRGRADEGASAAHAWAFGGRRPAHSEASRQRSTAPRARRDLSVADTRRLVARVRERGAVLVCVGGDLPGERSPVRLTVASASWRGLGDGWGHLQGRQVAVEATGRGAAARPRRADLWLPDPDGAVALVEPVASPIPLRPERAVPPAALTVDGG